MSSSPIMAQEQAPLLPSHKQDAEARSGWSLLPFGLLGLFDTLMVTYSAVTISVATDNVSPELLAFPILVLLLYSFSLICRLAVISHKDRANLLAGRRSQWHQKLLKYSFPWLELLWLLAFLLGNAGVYSSGDSLKGTSFLSHVHKLLLLQYAQIVLLGLAHFVLPFVSYTCFPEAWKREFPPLWCLWDCLAMAPSESSGVPPAQDVENPSAPIPDQESDLDNRFPNIDGSRRPGRGPAELEDEQP